MCVSRLLIYGLYFFFAKKRKQRKEEQNHPSLEMICIYSPYIHTYSNVPSAKGEEKEKKKIIILLLRLVIACNHT